MTRWILGAALVLTVLGVAPRAHALYCQGRIVRTGWSPARVRQLCGDPASITPSVVERSRTVHQRVANGVVVSDTITVRVQIETWVYDFGPRRFMQELIFEDGRLARIDALGYGTPGGREARVQARRDRRLCGMVRVRRR